MTLIACVVGLLVLPGAEFLANSVLELSRIRSLSALPLIPIAMVVSVVGLTVYLATSVR